MSKRRGHSKNKTKKSEVNLKTDGGNVKNGKRADSPSQGTPSNVSSEDIAIEKNAPSYADNPNLNDKDQLLLTFTTLLKTESAISILTSYMNHLKYFEVAGNLERFKSIISAANSLELSEKMKFIIGGIEDVTLHDWREKIQLSELHGQALTCKIFEDMFNYFDDEETAVNELRVDNNNTNKIINKSHYDEYSSSYDENGDFNTNGDDEEKESLSGEEYSFDLELSSNFFDPFKYHEALFKLLRITIPNKSNGSIKDESRKWKLFSTLAVLCDPYTQPSSTGEDNSMILSADLVSDLVISLVYNLYVESDDNNNVTNIPEFEMAFDLAFIIEKIMIILNCDNESILMYIENDEDNWENELHKWLPHDTFSNVVNIASDFHHMMLLFTISTAGLLVIDKLYRNNGNICLNPFLSFYLQLWKNQTRIIFLGIEIDRRDEENGFPGYPEVIRYMIKGAAAVRSMISLILNDESDKRIHDLKHESLINFMRPWGRKFKNGSIKRDLRVFVAALLALGSELDNVTELLFNFFPEDRYDEDVKYMFEMELDDMQASSCDDNTLQDENENCEYYNHHKETVTKFLGKNKILEIHREEIENDEEIDETQSLIKRSSVYDLHPDCECEFEDFESDSQEDLDDDFEDIDGEIGKDSNASTSQLDSNFERSFTTAVSNEVENKTQLNAIYDINNAPIAVRSKKHDTNIFDFQGRDWRDIPRGENSKLTNEFIELLKASIEDSNIFITPMHNLLSSLQLLTKETLDSNICEKIIKSVAWVVQYEAETKLMSTEEIQQMSDPTVNTDVIYNFLKSDDNFTRMIEKNPSTSFSIIDELLMAEGYRRVLIWFLAHLPLNQWIINYFHDLLAGIRGNPEQDNSYNVKINFAFSRVGALELSELEKSMLLHEFLSNAVMFLSRGSSYELEDLVFSNRDKQDKNEADEENVKNEKKTDVAMSSFITKRSNAQKLIKVICLMLKSLESKGVIEKGDPEYQVEIQTLLFQWVGVGFVPEARELFFRYNKNINRGSNEGNINKGLKQRRENDFGVCKEKIEINPKNQIFKLLQTLTNFEDIDRLSIVLNMAINYHDQKEVCHNFFNDINQSARIYHSKNDFVADCDEIFVKLNMAFQSDNKELIMEILSSAKILDNKGSILKVKNMLAMILEEASKDEGTEIRKSSKS